MTLDQLSDRDDMGARELERILAQVKTKREALAREATVDFEEEARLIKIERAAFAAFGRTVHKNWGIR